MNSFDKGKEHFAFNPWSVEPVAGGGVRSRTLA